MMYSIWLQRGAKEMYEAAQIGELTLLSYDIDHKPSSFHFLDSLNHNKD